ncbi:MAG: hypothetical protein QOJ82_1371, partial [Solirubrobacteraceae bacterium]|nr:hypothetical protein [Solirubrobacteraceae bacterium]
MVSRSVWIGSAIAIGGMVLGNLPAMADGPAAVTPQAPTAQV